MDDLDLSALAPAGTCPECGAHFEDPDELGRHMERHTGLARDSDGAGGVVPEDQQAQNGAGRIQTE